jgi:hypothetical protein
MSYLKDREIWLSSVPTGNPPSGYVWVFIQNGVFVVRDSSGVDKIMATTTGTVTNATSASYVEYSNVADKPALISGSSQVSYTGLSDIPAGIVSGSAQVSFNGIVDKPTLVSGSAQVSFNGIVDKPTLVSGSSQVTYSGLTGVPAGIVSSSAQVGGYNVFATTGSNQFNGSQAITGSLTVTGQVVAQTLNVQQVTSSIVFSSGSNIFGNSVSNTQQFTGSLQVTGSTHYLLGNMGIGTTSPDVFSRGDERNVGISVPGASDNLALALNAGGSAGRGAQIYMGQGGTRHFTISSNVTETRVGTATSTPLILTTNDTARLTIASSTGAATFSNNVTIGQATAATNVKLILNGVVSKAAGIEFHQSGTPQWYIGNGIASEDNNFELYNSNGTMAMKIIKSTNAINFIGAATFSSSVTAVNAILSGTGSAFADGLRINRTTSNSTQYTLINHTGGATNIVSVDQSGNNIAEIYFGRSINGSTISNSMMIDRNGNVGIGTTSPSQLLDIRSANTSGASGATLRIGSQTHGGGGDEFANIEFFWGDPDAAEVKAKIYAKNVGNVGPGGGGAADLLFATTPAFGSSTERMRISSGGNVSIADGTFTVSQSSATRVVQLLGTGNSQGTSLNYKVVRHFPVVSSGNKLTIPFISQENLNSTTIVKIMGHSARFNSRAPIPFSAYFAVGHLSVLSDLTAWEINGNISSIGYGGGMNIDINFSTAYTSAEANGIFITIEYMTNVPSYSINVAGITMN